MNNSGIHMAMEEEDETLRSAIKRAAFEYESHGDPNAFQAHIEELLEGSKARQRALFQKFGLTSAQPHQVSDR